MRYGREIKSPLGQKLVLSLFFTIGSLLVLVSLLASINQVRFVVGAQRVTGELTGYEREESSEGSTSYRPQFRFTDAQGQVHEATADVGSSSRPYPIGAALEILYDPADPRRASINDWSMWLGPIMLGLFGAMFASMASIGYLRYRPRWRRLAAERRGETVEEDDAIEDHETSPNAARGMLLLFFVLGLGMSLGSAGWVSTQYRFLATAEAATGNITGYERQRDTEGRTTYAPKFRFTDSRGEPHEIIANTSSSSRKYAIGDSVPILYDPDNPFQASIDSWWSIWGGPVLLGVLGGGFTAISTLGFFVMRRRGWKSSTSL